MENSTDKGRCEASDPVDIIFMLIPTSLITVMVLIGNLLVILALFYDRHLRTPPNFYLASLALVDFIMGAFVLPLNILNHLHGCWTMGSLLCKLHGTADIALCTASIFHLCVIALDRYWAISEGAEYVGRRSVKKVGLTVILIWILSLWISSPPLLGWRGTALDEMSEAGDSCLLLDTLGYLYFSSFGSFYLPLILMVCVYVKIYWALKAKIRIGENGTAPDSEEEVTDTSAMDLTFGGGNGEGRAYKMKAVQMPGGSGGNRKPKFALNKEKKAAVTVGIIAGAFVVCWLPLSLTMILPPQLAKFGVPYPSEEFYHVVIWLSYFNSAVNPIIYTMFNPEFRRAFKKMLHLP